MNWKGYSRLLSTAEILELEDVLDESLTVFTKGYGIDTFSKANATEDAMIRNIDRKRQLGLD